MLDRLSHSFALLVLVFLGGCASMQSHDKLASEVQATSRAGGFPAAIAQLDQSASSEEDKAALLYNLERGELTFLQCEQR